ncbi:MAG: uridine kinase [Bacteroidota bacterium]|nr:uridine kinase [Bacteroidota bacterium]
MLIIGIAGGTGSGKTTVVRKITEQLPKNEVAVISQDSYYKDNSHLLLEERQKINFDHPNSIEFNLLAKHLNDLKQDQTIQEPKYSYLTCTRLEDSKTVSPKNVIIVEGILILTDPGLRELFDIKLFVYTDDDIRLSRVIKRDIVERGRTVTEVLDRYHATVKPMHDQFIEPSKRHADLIIPEGGHNQVAIDIISGLLQKYL